MNRRNFIVNLAQLSMVGVVILGTPTSLFAKPLVQVEFNGKLLKGVNSQILSSSDKGMTWDVSADFRSECYVQELYPKHQYACAQINHKGRRFLLTSMDGITWRN